MNQHHKDKRKFTYFEHKNVFSTLELIAEEETSMHGRIVRVPELIRRMTRVRANKYRTKHGQPEINYDTSSGKSAPPPGGSATLALVNMRGGMEVFDKRGNKMKEWTKVDQIPDLLRGHPKCKIQYDATHILKYL
jgi:hypothetical protein